MLGRSDSHSCGARIAAHSAAARSVEARCNSDLWGPPDAWAHTRHLEAALNGLPPPMKTLQEAQRTLNWYSPPR